MADLLDCPWELAAARHPPDRPVYQSRPIKKGVSPFTTPVLYLPQSSLRLARRWRLLGDRPSYLILVRFDVESGGLSLIFGDLFHEGLSHCVSVSVMAFRGRVNLAPRHICTVAMELW